jgi:hypothetical protein
VQSAPWDILVQLVQIGGIGGTLAFLALGYHLLWQAQNRKDGSGNPVPPDKLTIQSTYRFMSYALVFFAVGTAAQLGTLFAQETVKRWNQPALSQLLFDRWKFFTAAKRLDIGFSEASFEDAPVIAKSKRGAYNIYVGVRAKPTTGPLAGAYPILFGPFSFGSIRALERDLSAEQFAALGSGEPGSCVQFVLFGVEKSVEIVEPFNPGSLAPAPIVFNNVFSCMATS